MDYIHGNVADELRKQRRSDPCLFGTVEQDRKFKERMAHIQATLASFRFPKIGAIYFDEKLDNFYIGPELQTGKGPWTTSAEYYDDLACHLMRASSGEHPRDTQSFMLPSILNFLLRISGEEKNGPFRLTNRDFGAHNILVNEAFDIVGVIDFDGVMAAPLEAVAQYPVNSFLRAEPPGVVDPRPAVAERVAAFLPKLQAYKEMLAKCEVTDVSDSISVSSRLASASASAYQGMVDYEMHSESMNDRWMKSCLKALQTEPEDGVTRTVGNSKETYTIL